MIENQKDRHLYQIIILAAGSGSRMGSSLPKVMHEVGGIPMVERVINNAIEVTDDIILVYSSALLPFTENYKNTCKLALQEKPLGTAHAVYSALNLIDKNKITAVIYGDNPFITADIIEQMFADLLLTNSDLVTLSFLRDDPSHYGRIITDKNGEFLRIVEFKYANEEELRVKLCNSGIMAFNKAILNDYISKCVSDECATSEFYLTNIVEICKNDGKKVSFLLSANQDAVIGVNTKEELLAANNVAQNVK